MNVGSSRRTSLNELVALMAEVTGERPEVEYRPGRAIDVPTNVLDVARTREELGRSPRTYLADGIARTWDWIRTQDHAGRKVGELPSPRPSDERG